MIPPAGGSWTGWPAATRSCVIVTGNLRLSGFTRHTPLPSLPLSLSAFQLCSTLALPGGRQTCQKQLRDRLLGDACNLDRAAKGKAKRSGSTHRWGGWHQTAMHPRVRHVRCRIHSCHMSPKSIPVMAERALSDQCIEEWRRGIFFKLAD